MYAHGGGVGSMVIRAILGSTGIDVSNIEASRILMENEIIRRTEQGKLEEAAALQKAYNVIYDTAASGRMPPLFST